MSQHMQYSQLTMNVGIIIIIIIFYKFCFRIFFSVLFNCSSFLNRYCTISVCSTGQHFLATYYVAGSLHGSARVTLPKLCKVVLPISKDHCHTLSSLSLHQIQRQSRPHPGFICLFCANDSQLIDVVPSLSRVYINLSGSLYPTVDFIS